MIENERKYLLRGHRAVENAVSALTGKVYLTQGYMDSFARIRRYKDADGVGPSVFTYKRRQPNGRNIEIETEIPDRQFDLLWPECLRKLSKYRFKIEDATPGVTWDIDFFTAPDSSVYFALAEVEMPEDMEEPPHVLAAVSPYVAFVVPRDDARFTSHKLCDVAYARALAAEYGAAS